MPGTILLGIDVESASDDSRGYAEYATEMYHDLSVPVTYYVTGRVLEMHPQVFAALEHDPLIDLQCHTYDHILLKTVFMDLPPGIAGHDDKRQYLRRGVTLEETDADLVRCGRVFQDVLGREPRGLTGPWGYYRGLQDRPDILEIVHRHGFRHLRTFARNEHDCQPVPLDWQPFFYETQGFDDVLEILVHDYQDDFYWRMFARPGPDDTYQAHLRTVARRVAQDDLVWSACSHDHGCATRQSFEHKSTWLRDFITYAKDTGIRFTTADRYYEEALAGRRGA
ncbi:MAG: polysaccharide deacetylase family protein [Armatimonadota bacterium]|nr:MAG: polysaccharide deacetylase family protein [Armatimonadota bacterium]